MPKQSGSKRERQYEHIKDSAKKRGASTKRAKEVAARTVNKQRAQKGETEGSRGKTTASPSSRRGGGGSSNGGKTREQLYNEAKKLGIAGRSRMTKQQLQRAVSRKK